MQKYYLNKLKTIEDKVVVSKDDDIRILTYCTLPDNRIKANLEIGMNGFQKSVYFNSEVELEQYKQEQCVTFCIEGLDVDMI